ncbi:developmental pluripotency-associated protein 3 [Onychomys torridus]|uniref:developmental pluripotency-associated protein 3 n=1 Tax=Onychomys torridus TaxID=38674 RepID=UPI00167F6C16|nr:developmental pluripotency-associated protein 3 [Onychomys torridus]
MEEPSEMFEQVLTLEIPQTSDDEGCCDDSGRWYLRSQHVQMEVSVGYRTLSWGTAVESLVKVSQPEMLAKDLKKLSLDPSAEKSPSFKPVRYHRRRHRRSRPPVKKRVVENNSEKILRAVQSAFPKRRVRTLLSVQNDPVARMKRFMRDEESKPFRCLCTFCLYQGWDPAENAKIGQN